MANEKAAPKAILETLLGKNKSDAVRDAVKEAAKTLDGAGVARKEGEAESDTPASSGDAILSALESAGAGAQAEIVKSLLSAIEAAGAMEAVDKATGSHEATIAMLLKAVSPPPADEPLPAEVPAEYAGEMMKSMKEYIASTTKDMGQIAQSQIDLAKAVQELASQNRELTAQKKETDERLAAIEKQLSGRPRQASAAEETEVKDKSVTESIRKGIEGESKVLGVVVPKEYADKVNGTGGQK